MEILHERQSKRFFIAVCAVIAAAFLLSIIISYNIGNRSKRVALDKEKTVAASLLDAGVDENTVAKALLSDKTSADGDLLLQKIGQTGNAQLAFNDPYESFRNYSLSINLFSVGLFSVALLFAVILFLNRREKLYSDVEKTIASYNEGDFSHSLPSNETGTVYRVFADVENLAKALKAKNEAELKTKEFLKSMISDVSHQLKTPIAAITMYNEIIAAEPTNVDAVKEFSLKSRHSIERIERLVKTILKIARLDTGSVVFEKRKYAVSEVVAQSVEQLATRAEVEGKKITISGNTDIFINCDIDWTAEALGNLIKNALDYTRSGGKIDIICDETPVMTRITVRDNGKGIYPDDLHNIFKRFYRSKHSVDAQGAGLGLPLAKSIIEGQDGVISVESVIGEGTSFTISFLTKL